MFGFVAKHRGIWPVSWMCDALGVSRSGLHCVERLMRQAAFRARPKRRQPPKDQGTRSIIAANVLEREFEADGPNQI